MSKKYIRDGQVAVIYSPGYGAGWSTWNEHEELLSTDARIVERVLEVGYLTQEWLRENNYEVHPEMSGQMKGMASEQQMQQLNDSTGDEFDMLYLELMIEHHIGGVEMAEKQVRQGSNQKLIEMAESMVKIQEEEISLMREWQNEWSNN